MKFAHIWRTFRMQIECTSGHVRMQKRQGRHTAQPRSQTLHGICSKRRHDPEPRADLRHTPNRLVTL